MPKYWLHVTTERKDEPTIDNVQPDNPTGPELAVAIHDKMSDLTRRDAGFGWRITGVQSGPRSAGSSSLPPSAVSHVPAVQIPAAQLGQEALPGKPMTGWNRNGEELELWPENRAAVLGILDWEDGRPLNLPSWPLGRGKTVVLATAARYIAARHSGRMLDGDPRLSGDRKRALGASAPASRVPAAPESWARVADDDLGLLVWCALSHDRRLPAGIVPSRVWERLTARWRADINKWQSAERDVLGAELRKPGD